MFIVIVHNEYDRSVKSEAGNRYVGPFQSQESAIAYLRKLVVDCGDSDLKISDDGTYAGYEYEDLIEAERKVDLCTEIWMEVSEVGHPI